MAATLTLCDGPNPWSVHFSESKQIYLLLIAVSLIELFLQRDIKKLSFIRF